MKRYDAYEIRHTYTDADGVTAPSTELTVREESDMITGIGTVQWSLYGHIPDAGVDWFFDHPDYQTVRELYGRITGNDCGAEEQDHFNLPIGAT